MTCPEPDVEAVQLAIRGGLTLGDVLKAYRIGHACTWDVWLEVLAEVDNPEARTQRCFAALSEFVTHYDERLADLVAEEYKAQSEHITPDTERARLQLFIDLIEGRPDRANGMDYSLDLEHIGVIASGVDAAATLRQLARTLDRRFFFVRAEDGLLMGWVGGREPLSDEAAATLRHFQPSGETTLALGDPHRGYEGLRRTHREAGDAHVVANKRPRPVTFYSDVSLEALALRDEQAAREFVSDLLAGIDGEDPRSVELRHTLSVYFSSEQNAASTASALHVHEATIGRRLAEIEKRTGRRVNQRRAEFETALRLRDLFDSGHRVA